VASRTTFSRLRRGLADGAWLAGIVGSAGAGAVFFLWHSLRTAEKRDLALLSESTAHAIAFQLRGGLQSLGDALARVARPYADAIRSGSPTHIALTSLTGVAWVDPAGTVIRVTPEDRHQELVGTHLGGREGERLALLKAGTTGRTVIAPSVHLPGGKSVFHIVVPVRDGAALRGFAVGLFAGDVLYPAALEAAAPGWSVGVFEDGRELYRRGTPTDGKWLGASRLFALGTEREIRVAPGPVLAAQLRGPLPGVVLATGLTIMTLLAAAIAFAQSAVRRAREAEAARDTVRSNEAASSAVLDGALDAVITMDTTGAVRSWNRRAEALFGWPRQDAVGRRLADLIIPQRYRDAHAQGLARFRATGEGRVIGQRLETSALRRDGTECPVELTVTAVKQADAVQFTAFVADISARQDAERKLRESEQQYRLLFDSNPHPMWVYDEDTLRYLAVNDAAVVQYGYSREDFLSMTVRDVLRPEDLPAFDAGMDTRRRERAGSFHSPRVWRHVAKDGRLFHVEVSGSPIDFKGRRAWLTLVTDITEKKRLEEQLLQSQKMESVGRLAGGVAHDFNNLLGVISGYGELLQREMGREHPSCARVSEILKAAARAAALTRQLLAFSRKQVLEAKVLDLNVVVGEVETMLRRLIGEHIELVTIVAPELGQVKADPGQIQQVIVNLAVNARDAMPGGGTMIIETANVDLDEAYARSRPDAQAGPHVMVAVSDTGYGMDAETASHCFEPFFTTKAPGEGTGLGLATAHGIVRQSGGHVMVYSEPGRGTTFKVYLPRLAAKGHAETAKPASTAPPPRGTETIVLIEDEASLRMMIGEILKSSGYVVLESASPADALPLARAHEGPIPLVVTDVVLPGMSGHQAVEALRSSRPDIRALFISGYTDDAIGRHGIIEAGTHFLQKPFTVDVLLRKVREVLDDGAATG
jgi:two-component system cell cycle sensor histidine kinase/response regulator CckA